MKKIPYLAASLALGLILPAFCSPSSGNLTMTPNEAAKLSDKAMVSKDFARALELCRYAVNQGDALGLNNLGVFYAEGYGA